MIGLRRLFRPAPLHPAETLDQVCWRAEDDCQDHLPAWQRYLGYRRVKTNKTCSGKPSVQVSYEAVAVAGIKVDTGIAPLPGAEDEGYTMGLDGLPESVTSASDRI